MYKRDTGIIFMHESMTCNFLSYLNDLCTFDKCPSKGTALFCCPSSQSRNEALNLEQKLTLHCKFRMAPSNGLSGILC